MIGSPVCYRVHATSVFGVHLHRQAEYVVGVQTTEGRISKLTKKVECSLEGVMG